MPRSFDQISLSRRTLLAAMGSASALAIAAPAKARSYPVNFTEDQWRQRLTPTQFAILRKAGTERAYSSPLNGEHRSGTFVCPADRNPLFSSKTKFDSHTGWPSFWKPLPGAVLTATDRTFGMVRTEVRCSRCGGHLGHVFDDGPPPTGKRYCMNGAAMIFTPG
ncbi:peptide-methionine (R)-S-oxide reductase MsrB [Novosphingobium sp. 9]|uniref:peptide-methionine (R)-S-oxide reductase MsrB n=1 Tax=Novosphingobium sp. 9 TaxID=2025349 RepID=UPI0021B6CF07|nr:peptide-methionine (R)-S-oxide reductase MsrB [Novosphingobium sp. 9]